MAGPIKLAERYRRKMIMLTWFSSGEHFTWAQVRKCLVVNGFGYKDLAAYIRSGWVVEIDGLFNITRSGRETLAEMSPDKLHRAEEKAQKASTKLHGTNARVMLNLARSPKEN